MVIDLLEWCQVLDGVIPYRCTLLVDPDVQWTDGLGVMELAKRTFKSVDILCPPPPCPKGWPAGPNAMFLFAAEQMALQGDEPWLWLEPDAIPIRAGWMQSLEQAYSQCGRQFMGAIIEGEMRGHGCLYMNGVAVYPGKAIEVMGPAIRESKEAFDVSCAPIIRPIAANTSLVHCHWGLHGTPPTFSRNPSAPNMLTLQSINPGAVLFHRNKDGSLIDLLNDRLNAANGSHITVVLGFCNKDGNMAQQTVQWMREMGSTFPNPFVLCCPRDTLPGFAASVESNAGHVFSSVRRFTCTGSSSMQWPVGPNVGWQSAARYMLQVKSPWLWLEPDAIPLKHSWLSRLEREYHFRKKSFFGPLVENRGHMNGVAIYPSDTAQRCPKAMSATTQAWDWILGGELGTDVYNASGLIQHCWGIVGGRPHPSDGPAAHFANKAELDNWLLPTAVVFHRCKDGSLINRLRELAPPCKPKS